MKDIASYIGRANRRTGSFLAELPGVLLILFFLFVFPMINLGSIALRWALLAESARDGAHAAATAYTFDASSAGKPSAIVCAPTAINAFNARYSGITITNIDVDILATDLNTQVVTRYEDKLTTPANTQVNIYALETAVTADLEPLLTYHGPFIFNVPGLTAPWTATVRAKEYAESPQGLNQ